MQSSGNTTVENHLLDGLGLMYEASGFFCDLVEQVNDIERADIDDDPPLARGLQVLAAAKDMPEGENKDQMLEEAFQRISKHAEMDFSDGTIAVHKAFLVKLQRKLQRKIREMKRTEAELREDAAARRKPRD